MHTLRRIGGHAYQAVRGAAMALLLGSVACAGDTEGRTGTANKPDYAAQRKQLVDGQLAGRSWGAGRLTDKRVLDAMRKVPRHAFVPREMRPHAYADTPLPIGHEQTISQPFVVAAMTQLLAPEEDDKVLEIGTGSGYQAAVLAELANEVYTIEIVPELGKRAKKTLDRLDYGNVHVLIGDGYKGWPEHAPFDGIIVTAAPDEIPAPLIEQLKPGGRMVIPVGPVYAMQYLTVAVKQEDGTLDTRQTMPVRFVPFTRNENLQPEEVE